MSDGLQKTIPLQADRFAALITGKPQWRSKVDELTLLVERPRHLDERLQDPPRVVENQDMGQQA